jgi:hypothetical protein
VLLGLVLVLVAVLRANESPPQANKPSAAAAASSESSTTPPSTLVATSTTSAPVPTSTIPPITDAPATDVPVTAVPTTRADTAPIATTPSGTGNRPWPPFTPGVADPRVTQANIHSTICVSGYTKTVRNVSAATKREVFAEYGIADPTPGAYEVDHLISLELGGSNDIGNLWPEPYSGADNAHDKDTIENRLHSQVCSGTLSLTQAQYEIVHWWEYGG